MRSFFKGDNKLGAAADVDPSISAAPPAADPPAQDGDPSPSGDPGEPAAAPALEPELPAANPSPALTEEPPAPPAPPAADPPAPEAAPVVAGKVPLRAPRDVTSCAISDGTQYEAVDGIIQVEERHVAHLVGLGFTIAD